MMRIAAGILAATLAAASAPAAPTDLVATVVSATQIDLTWTDNADDENGIRVLRCQGDADCFDFGQVASLPPNTTSYSDTGLVPGITYRYVVNAFNLGGNSYSGFVTATTPQIPPAAPTGLSAAAGKHGYRNWVDLMWGDSSNNEAAFVIERCTGAGCTDFVAIASVAEGTTTYRDESVGRRTVYQYRVKATNSAGDSGYSNVAATMTR